MSVDSPGSQPSDRELAGRDYSFADLGVEGLQPEIADRLPAMKSVFRERDLDLEVVAAQTWHGHSFYSLHHTGFAIDLNVAKVDHLTVAELVEALRQSLGSAYRVLAYLDVKQPHLHVEFQSGLRISEPVDDPWQDFSSYV